MAEHLDHLHYLNDILIINCEFLNDVLTDHLLNRLFLPLYVYSLENPDKVSLQLAQCLLQCLLRRRDSAAFGWSSLCRECAAKLHIPGKDLSEPTGSPFLMRKWPRNVRSPVSEGKERPSNQHPCAVPRVAAVSPTFSDAHWSLPSDSYQAALEPLCVMHRKCWSMLRERSSGSSTGARDRVGDGDFLGYHLLSGLWFSGLRLGWGFCMCNLSPGDAMSDWFQDP